MLLHRKPIPWDRQNPNRKLTATIGILPQKNQRHIGADNDSTVQAVVSSKKESAVNIRINHIEQRSIKEQTMSNEREQKNEEPSEEERSNQTQRGARSEKSESKENRLGKDR
ncbi:hypothetical protein BH10CYA1_BH10CYA1_59120 [soil metagenome]